MWRRWCFNNFTTHAVSSELESALISDLEARGAEHMLEPETLKGPEIRTSWGLDLGGSIFENEPTEDFLWEGLEMSVRSAHLETILVLLRKLSQREFAEGIPYYKLTVWLRSLVMTPRQRDGLIAALEVRVEDAEKHYSEFVAARKARMQAEGQHDPFQPASLRVGALTN